MADYSDLGPQPVIFVPAVSVLLPEPTLLALRRIGLPMDVALERELLFNFEPYEGQFKPITFEANLYIPIGRYNQQGEYFQTVALRANSGNLYLLTDFEELPPESSASREAFINSNIEAFLQFCKAYLRYSKTLTDLADRKSARFPSLSDEETVEMRKAIQSKLNSIITQLEKEFTLIDLDAIDNVYTFWGELLFSWRIA